MKKKDDVVAKTNFIKKELSNIDEYLTLKEAAHLFNKTISNISYLIQYDRINRYNSKGEKIKKAKNGGLRVSKKELITYFSERKEFLQNRMKQLSITDMTLAFIDVPERERTKHVHRIHPYLGKFIPQLVEHFLTRFFKPNQIVIDPFCGSGTTLVQACENGLHSIGIDISEFNTLISKVKLADYDLEILDKEVLDIMNKTIDWSSSYFDKNAVSFIDNKLTTDSEYLKTWFAERSLKEILYFNHLIKDYQYKNLLRVILSRTIRSCRLVHHYDLASPKNPVIEPYQCYKHKNKICTPVKTISPRLKFYSNDTIRRIRKFKEIRVKNCDSIVIEADSQTVNLDQTRAKKLLKKHTVGGIFTSPPYVGQIDYHEQHRYAYELFGFTRRDKLEIGPKFDGKSQIAQKKYIEGISAVFKNISEYTPSSALWFIVANDKLSLYPTIFEKSGLKIIKTYNRPVEDRTERDKRPYSENVFMVKKT
ncbi:DNA methyltransferase [Thermoproteota archaeon]